MRSHFVLVALVGMSACGSFGNSSLADCVFVGNSSLIHALDYSDTFTVTGTDTASSSQRVSGYAPGDDSPAGANLYLENNYGNPNTSWCPARLRFYGDGSASDYALAGDIATFAYGRRRDYVVQVDAKLIYDRFNIATSSESSSSIFGVGATTFFLRRANDGYGHPCIGIFNSTYGETDTGLSTGVSDLNYHNFAVEFNHNADTATIYVDQVSVGSLNLASFASGHYSLPTGNAAYIGIGAATADNVFDNFQVGAVPEPASIIVLLMGLLGLLAYAWRKRK